MAAEDRSTSFVIAFEGKGSGLAAFLQTLKRDMRDTVRDLQNSADSLSLFKAAKADADRAATAFEQTRKRLEEIRAEVARVEASGGNISRGLAKGLKEAESAFRAHAKELDRANTALEQARNTMRAAEVATARLAAEQKVLAAEWNRQMQAATAAQKAADAAVASSVRLAQEVKAIGLAFQANKEALGFKTLRDVQPEIDNVRRAFAQLRDSGKLSFGEISVAAAMAEKKVKDLRAEAGSVGEAFRQMRAGLVGIAAILTGITLGAGQSAANFRAFAQQMAAVSTIAAATDDEMRALSDGVRELARTMGVDAVESAKALYEIISSGIPANNALEVLAISTKAAVAGMTSVATAARVGVAVLNSYGLEVSELARVQDVLFRTVDSGVITFEELANNFGEVTGTARTAKVGIETLGASFVLLTKTGINAAESATAIRSAILNIAAPAPEARERFRELGIELGNFESVIRQIGERGLSLDVIRQIIPDIRASKAVQVLAQNFQELDRQLAAMNASAGATEAAYGKMAQTPQARVDRFNASIKDLSISIGEFVSNATAFVEDVTSIVNAFNKLDAATRGTIIQFAAFGTALLGAVAALRTMAPLINVFVGSLFQAIPALRGFTAATDAATLAMRALGVVTGIFLAYQLGKWADENIPAMSKFFDILEIAGGNLALQVGVLFDGISEGLRGNAEGFRAASERATTFNNIMRAEVANVLSGAAQRVKELTKEQAALREELGRSIATAQSSAQGVGTAIGAVAANVKTLLSGVEQQIQLFEGRLTGLVAKLGESVGQTQQLAQQAQSEVAERLKVQLAELETLRVSELQRMQQITAAEDAALDERLRIIREYAARSKVVFEAEAAARLEVAKRSGENIKQVEFQLNAQRRELLLGNLNALRGHLLEQLGAYKTHYDKMRALDEQRRTLAQDTEQTIREIRRESLNAFQQYADKIKEIDELQSKARQALLKGELTQAEEFSKAALALSKSLQTQVEQDGQVVVNQLQGQNKKIGEITESADILNSVIKRRGQFEKQAADDALAGYEQTQRAITELQKEVDRLQKQAVDGVQLKVQVQRQELDETLDKLNELQREENRLIDIQAKIRLAEGSIEDINRELGDGVTVNITPRTEAIEKALRDIAAAEPTLQVKTDEAIAKIDGVRTAAKSLEDIRVRLQLNDDDLKAARAAIKTLEDVDGKTYRTTLEVNVRRTGDELPGPLQRNQGGPIPGFKRGGYVGRARNAAGAQRFARGGDVFAPLRAHKVPGVGSGDTHPARLKAGSFVLRKDASQYYGDRLLAPLHRGFARGGDVQSFAIGGIAERLLRGLKTAAAGIFGAGGRKSVNMNTGQLGRGATGEIIEAAIRVFQPLIDASRTLPKSRTGQNLSDYLARVLEIITSTYSSDEAGQLLSNIAGISDNLMASIRTAHKFRVPIVMGAFANPSETTGPSELFKQLMENMRTGGTFKQGTSNPYAEGGQAPDTVPAWLTPGEHVINPTGVKRAARMFGSSFLHALNQKRIPRGMLAGMYTPPRIQRFEHGGEVSRSGAATAQPPRAAMMRGSAGGGDTFNFPGFDVSNPEAYFRRYFVPLLEERDRRMGRR